MNKFILAVSATLLLSGCTKCDNTTGTSKSVSKTTTSAPAATTTGTATKTSTTTSKEPAYIDPNLAFEGEGLYQQNCVACHQADAIGKPGFAPSLTNKEFLSIAPVNFLVDTIKNGRAGTGMPPFKHLGEKKINAIVAYLRDQAKLPSRITEVLKQPHSQGDPRIGKILFEQVCSTCHGPGGNGYVSGGTGTAVGKKGFLDVVSDGFIRTTIKEGRSNTRMLPFQGPASIADLSNKEIDDIIAYLRTAPGE